MIERTFWHVRASLVALAALLMLLGGCTSQSKRNKSTELSTLAKPHIQVNVARQLLILYTEDGHRRVYPISTGKQGVGQQAGSLQTPLGKHVIIDKVGDGLPWNAIYKHGIFTGKYYSQKQSGGREDPILSRIIRLAGTEKGFNLGEDVDTESRRIYIHGTPPSERPQDRIPLSRGCIRMDVNHIIDLYQRAPLGTHVEIKEK